MIWILIALCVAGAVAFMLRTKASTRRSIDNSDQKARALLLSEKEQHELAQEARRLALAGYDRLSEGARAAGKSETFAHQAGVLDAVYCVLANDDRSRQDDDVRRAMQMETIPFNKLDPVAGRGAVAEYLVWKFSPAQADKEKLNLAISQFVEDVFASADSNDDRFVFQMIYSNRHDWQKLAVEEAKARLKASDA